jgi:hypothetical protein
MFEMFDFVIIFNVPHGHVFMIYLRTEFCEIKKLAGWGGLQ